MPNPARRAVALAALAAAIVAGAVALDLSSAAAQSDEQAGRIVAQRLADGRTEFGWQPAGAARILPRARYFPADAQVGRWLNSSAVEVGGAEIGRINARLRSDGRIEFAFTPTDGERIEPRARYFPADARVGRWLRSTEITISAAPAGFVAVAAGDWHTCAIRAGTGAIECWGYNRGGQTDAPAGSFTAVSADGQHSCAIRAGSGAIECWGSNTDGRADAPAGSFTAVSAGEWHTCAIRAESEAIECWGANSSIQWTTPEAYEEVYDGRATPPAGRFSAVSAGLLHTCAIRAESGAIECWGIDSFGLLDDIPTGRFIAVSAGGNLHSCAIRESGEIECWGDNRKGKTGAPSGSFSAVFAGQWHTCAIRAESGAIECWGKNTRYQWNEETGETEEVYGGQTDPPAGSFTAVSAGGSHSCALRESGAIACWGLNDDGQTDVPAP